jgi:hypothetical protein
MESTCAAEPATLATPVPPVEVTTTDTNGPSIWNSNFKSSKPGCVSCSAIVEALLPYAKEGKSKLTPSYIVTICKKEGIPLVRDAIAYKRRCKRGNRAIKFKYGVTRSLFPSIIGALVYRDLISPLGVSYISVKHALFRNVEDVDPALPKKRDPFRWTYEERLRLINAAKILEPTLGLNLTGMERRTKLREELRKNGGIDHTESSIYHALNTIFDGPKKDWDKDFTYEQAQRFLRKPDPQPVSLPPVGVTMTTNNSLSKSDMEKIFGGPLTKVAKPPAARRAVPPAARTAPPKVAVPAPAPRKQILAQPAPPPEINLRGSVTTILKGGKLDGVRLLVPPLQVLNILEKKLGGEEIAKIVGEYYQDVSPQT